MADNGKICRYNGAMIIRLPSVLSSTLPRPRVGAAAALLLSGTAFYFGSKSGETVLLLAAFVLAVPFAWSFAALTLLAALHRALLRLNDFSAVTLSPHAVSADENIKVYIGAQSAAAKRVLPFSLPAVIIRYRLNLATKDGKQIKEVFGTDLWLKECDEFSIRGMRNMRGAYFGLCDYIEMTDVFGFFVFNKPVHSISTARLIVKSGINNNYYFPSAFFGGSSRRSGTRVIKTDDLTEQRPYVPGDDPRRINWKLLGHSENLFVREEDREPPPHTRLVLLLCAEAAPGLFRAKGEAAAAADTLCEAALYLAQDALQNGAQVFFGGCGVDLCELEAKNAAECLALPFACVPARADAALPVINSQEKEVTVLALPCDLSAQDNKIQRKKNALDNFLDRVLPNTKVKIFFMSTDEHLSGAAHAAALLYTRKEGVYAGAFVKST